MNKKTNIALAVSVAVVALTWFLASENQADEKLPILSKIEQKMKTSPIFVSLKIDGATRPDEYGRIKAEAEISSSDTGVYGFEQAHFTVFKEQPLDFWLVTRAYTRLIKADSKIYSEAECESIAKKALGNLFEDFLKQGALPPVSTAGPSLNGSYAFSWQRYRSDGFPDTDVRVTVRALDGKVTGFISSKFSGEWKHNVTPDQAKAKAIKNGASSSELKDVKVGRWSVDGAGGTRFYNIGLEATDVKTGQQLYTSVRLDAMTGAITKSIEGWSAASEVDQKKLSSPTDRHPVWTKQGLVFSSQRVLAGMPVWAPSREQLFTRDAQGEISAITSDLMDSAFSSVSATSSGDWVVFAWHGRGYAMDVKQGQYRVLATPERFFVTPSVRPDGRWIVAAGRAATGSAGLDLMPDTLERTPAMGLRGRLLIPKSSESSPVFSPNGKWLYFLKSESSQSGSTLSVQRIPASSAQTTERSTIKEEEQELIVGDIPFRVERLSISPDGKSLVAQVPDGYVEQEKDPKKPSRMVKIASRIVIIGTDTKQVRELKLPTLKDTEVKATIQDIKDAWAGPGNDEVTFSGQTIDADKKERRRIYSCRFDGSNLKALTPAENTPVPAYKFPQGDKTAYQLAKEMALGEIKWEDAHRDR